MNECAQFTCFFGGGKNQIQLLRKNPKTLNPKPYIFVKPLIFIGLLPTKARRILCSDFIIEYSSLRAFYRPLSNNRSILLLYEDF
jgi:hypothetical protein